MNAYPFTIQRTVRFGDCDPGGVLYTPNISFYIVEAIRSFLDHVMGAPFEKEILSLGVLPPAKAMSVEFHSFMAWDDEITISVAVIAIGNSSFKFAVRGFCSNTAAFSADFTQVCVDPTTKRPTQIPEKLRNALQPHVAPQVQQPTEVSNIG